MEDLDAIFPTRRDESIQPEDAPEHEGIPLGAEYPEPEDYLPPEGQSPEHPADEPDT